jgi:hypothetical protein
LKHSATAPASWLPNCAARPACCSTSYS